MTHCKVLPIKAWQIAEACHSPITGLSSRRRWLGHALASLSLIGTAPAWAAPGDLDPTFGNNGLLSLTIGDSGSAASAIVRQGDGKLVFAGYGTIAENGNDFVVVRTSADGTPDSSFGADGIASVDFAGHEDFASSIVQQTDGKLVLAGTAENTSGVQDIAVARFNADGSLDASFGSGGKTTLDIDGSHDFASSLILQAGGKLVIAGGAIVNDGYYQFVVARFNSNGTLDASFGTGGTVLIAFGSGDGIHSWARGLAQLPDGRLVAVGRVDQENGSDVGIARVTANGLPDSSFDGDGLLTVDIGGNFDAAFALAVYPDNAIVVAGSTHSADGSSSRALLLRVNEDGSLDNSFAAGVMPDIGLYSIVVQSDGKLVATGSGTTSGIEDLILARFNSDGAIDTTYGVDGVATADFGDRNIAPLSYGTELIQQGDGKFVAAGPNSVDSIGVARFDDNAVFAGRIGLTVTDQSVRETTPTATYTVRRTGGRAGAVSVNYATTAGQAQPGSDFEDNSGTLTWLDGDASDKTLSIRLIDDAEAEVDEDFNLLLSAPTGGAPLAAREATVTIVSEDGPGQLGFVNALDVDDVFEIGIFGDGVTFIFVVQRTAGSTGPVDVNYYTVDGTAKVRQDFEATSGTLTWTDGDNGDKAVAVEILDDQFNEQNEDFAIVLSNPTGGATIAALGGTQRVRILDDECGCQLYMLGTSATISEAAGSVSLNVARKGSVDGAVSVNYATSPGSAMAGSDFTGVSGTLNWAAGKSDVKTIAVNIANDSVDEHTEYFKVTISNPTAGMRLGPSVANVYITDNDPPGSGGGGGGSGGGALDWLIAILLSGFYLVRRPCGCVKPDQSVRSKPRHRPSTDQSSVAWSYRATAPRRARASA